MPFSRGAQLAAACKGRPIPEAAKFGGTVHPIVVVVMTNGHWGVDDGSIYGNNAKWFEELWPGPVQLVLCNAEVTAVEVGSCGMYQESGTGRIGEVVRYKYAQTGRVVVARTGKTLRSTTFYGSVPSCETWDVSQISVTPDGWRVDGATMPDDHQINNYATTVSKQKVK